MLEVRGLTVFYENALALNRLSLDVGRGEIVGLFGSNGAGKSTLMNTIAGLTLDLKRKEERKGGVRITIAGGLRFEGEDVRDLKASERVRRGIVLCRERHPIFRDSSVDENLRIAGFLRPRGEVAASVRGAYEFFPPLQALRDRRAGLLSGGEQQMLALGMALVARPRLLLLDEPLLGLAPTIQARIVGALTAIRERGVTLLVAEQYARPVFPIVTRAYVIENGNLVVSGTGRELLDNPEVRSAYLGV